MLLSWQAAEILDGRHQEQTQLPYKFFVKLPGTQIGEGTVHGT